jgi:phage tail-like protein
MPRISAYTRHLPPVLWTERNDPTQFLARALRIFEKFLHGPPIRGEVARAFAPTAGAVDDRIDLADPADAARFRIGDIVTLEGTTERQPISAIDADAGQLILAANLAAAHAAGTVRIADLETGQTTFRVDAGVTLGRDDRVLLEQGASSEIVTVIDNVNDLVSIAVGLNASYPMGADNVRVLLGDGRPLARGGDVDPAIDAILKRLHLLANPWRTEAERLPWLAQWVALDLDADWSEYQTRKVIASAVEIYRHRGLRHGLHTFLDIYALKGARPRIAVDDGNALLRARVPGADREVLPYAIAQAHTVESAAATASVLLHPTGVDVDVLNRYVVADEGDVSLSVPRPPAVWRVAPHGDVDFASGATMPAPDPLHSGAPLVNPRAVTVDGAQRYAVVDGGAFFDFFTPTASIFRFAPPNYLLTTVIGQTTVPALPVVNPVDMILDGAGNFVILDRGGNVFGDPPFGPSAPKIVVVSEGPLAVSTHPLASVTEPAAIVMDDAGRFIVADVRDHYDSVAVDLVRIDPGAGWAETSLLLGPPASSPNPLVAPTGMVMEGPQSLLLCDSGLRWGYDPLDPQGADPAYRYKAADAALFRVDLSATPPTITQISTKKVMVNPTRMKRDRNGDLVITDRGEKQRSLPGRSWRAGSNEYGVVVHFSRDTASTFTERNRLRRGIERVTDEEKPGHAAWWMDF